MEEIKEKLLTYFNKSGDHTLEVLDSEAIDSYGKDYYRGVTFDYLLEYVLLNQYSKLELIEALKELHFREEIKSLYCSDVKNIVFNNIINNHWNFNYENPYCNYYGIMKLYDYFETIKENKNE